MKLKPTKILVLVSSLEYYRSYITSHALDEIQEDCVFLVHPKLLNLDFRGISKEKIITYEYPRKKIVLHRRLFNINTWKYRKRSASFGARFATITKKRQRYLYKLFSVPGLYQLAEWLILLRTYDKQLFKIIKEISPDIILIPSSAYEGISFETIKIGKQLNIPTTMLIENWDNLSGKTIFTRMPDYLGVWSEQTAEFAVRIRNMPRDRIFIIGTPRFIDYYSKDKKFESPYPFKYAVFAGMSSTFDELSALKKIDDVIEKKKLGIKIIFRPHPQQVKRRCADTFFEYDFKHTILDNQARQYYKRGSDLEDGFNPVLYAPDINYYPGLLANMEFMVCSLSSLLIEGLIFGKKVYVLAYDDGIHERHPKFYYQNYEHFRGIEKLRNTRMIFNFDELEGIGDNDTNPLAEPNPLELEHFITAKTAGYPKELKIIVDTIIANNKSSKVSKTI